MQKKYSEDELATIVQQAIRREYSSPEKILNTFKTNIMKKIKSLNLKHLTSDELETRSLQYATKVFQELDKINNQGISRKLSNEIIGKSLGEGIVLSQYEDYINSLAKEAVKALIKAQFNFLKSKIK